MFQAPNVGVGGKDHGKHERLSDAEIQAFDGLNQSYIDMENELIKKAPKCHMKAMEFNQGDYWEGTEAWWECCYCGHTKDVK